MTDYSAIEGSFYPLSEIKDYKMLEGYVNLDDYEEKICNIILDINDKDYIEIAKKICKEDELDDSGFYYEHAWMVEVVVDIKSNIISNHELFYIANGRVEVGILEDKNNTNEPFIKEVDKYLLKEIKEYMANPSEWHKNM